MKIAKTLTLERLKESLDDFEQVGEFSFASLEEVEGEEWWVVVNIQAKKNYDIDAAIEEFEFEQKQKEEKEKKKKELKK